MAKEFPLISIITPSLNQGAYIEDNIKSVLNQSYPNFEHIIIDGDSTDGTIDILKKYDHLIWVSEKDRGQSEAINKGFKNAKGEIIGWLNSDDCYEPNAFFTIVKELNRAKGKYVVFGDSYVIDEKGNKIGYIKGRLPHPKDWFKYWQKDYRIPSASVFFYKDIFLKIGYLDEDIHYVMDDDFCLRINEHYQFNYVSNPLANMRIHDLAKTTLRGDMYEREWFGILKKNWANLSLLNRYTYLFMALSFRSNVIRESAYSKMEELSFKEFRKKILLSILISPLNLFKRKFVSALFRAILGHQLSNRIKGFLTEMQFSKNIAFRGIRNYMGIKFEKLILWDFLQLLREKKRIQSLEKMRYLFEEIISRIVKWTIKILFFSKFRDSENKLRKLAQNQGLEEILCNLCGSGEIEIVGEKRGFRVVKCSRCGLRFVNPRFNGKGRKIFYYSKYHFLGYPLFNILNKLDWAINENLAGELVLDIVRLYKKSGDLIEIGPFGQGLTEIAQKKGFKCWRLISGDWAYDSPIEEREYRTKNESASVNHKKFDVVSCLDILDRVPDPLGELKGLQRILKDDGILLVRVPNYSSTVAEEKGDAWHYNRPWEKIYQFDYLHLKDLLDKTRFKIVDLKTGLSEGIGYPGGLIIIAGKKNHENRKRNPKILLIKERARGDVLLTTPIIRALKEKYPNSSITFKTDFPEILDNNPYLDRITPNSVNTEYDQIYNLKYELFPEIPLIEAYTRVAQVEIKNPQLKFYLSKGEKEGIHDFFDSIQVKKKDKLAVVHPIVGGRMKSWNREKYQHICDYFRANNYRVITIGDFSDCVELIGAVDLIGKTSIRRVAVIISEADIFFGLDSFPMHLANAFAIPSVVLFGSTDPDKVICRNDIIKIIQSDEKCLGCRHDTTPDRWKQNVDCRRGRLYCMENISADRVIEEIDGILKSSCKKSCKK